MLKEGHTDIGPQYHGDSPFTARMRFHQSWYRARVLGVPYGTGPRQTDTAYYGNMLTRPDGEKGLNLVAPQAFSVARSRLAQGGGVVEPFRLLHNMLSSQPLCFNLFGPLAIDPDLATLAFQALLGSEEVQRVSEVVLEYAPEPKSEYLNDRTAFDAFVTYKRSDGQPGFLGIETKLTEPFSQKRYDSPAYRRWVELPDSPWPPEAWGRLADTQHNQLWRDHLLAVAMLRHPESAYASGRFALVRHPEDQDCADVVNRYRRLLKPDDGTFMDLPLDHVVDSWQRSLPAVCTKWLDSLHLRYLDLGASEEAWGLWGAPLGLDRSGRDVALSEETGKRELHHGSKTKIQRGLQAAGGGGVAGRQRERGAVVPALRAVPDGDRELEAAVCPGAAG